MNLMLGLGHKTGSPKMLVLLGVKKLVSEPWCVDAKINVLAYRFVVSASLS